MGDEIMSGKPRIVTKYTDDKVIFSVTKIKDGKKETGQIELIALVNDLRKLKDESHKYYNPWRAVTTDELQEYVDEDVQNYVEGIHRERGARRLCHPGSLKCDSPVLVGLLEEIEKARQRS